MQAPFGWIIVLAFLLCAILFAFFILMSRFRVRTQQRWRHELQEGMEKLLKRRQRSIPTKLKAALDHLVRTFDKEVSSGKSIVRVQLPPGIELRQVASDTLSLRMLTADGRWFTLYKSFECTRIEKIKPIARGFELRIKST